MGEDSKAFEDFVDAHATRLLRLSCALPMARSELASWLTARRRRTSVRPVVSACR